MNRAERRANGVNGHAPEPAVVILTMTEAQRDLHMPHVKDGDLITVTGRRRSADGGIEACEPGQETPLLVEIIK